MITQERLSQYTVRLKGGREYLTVAGRLLKFRSQHPDFGIATDVVEINMERHYAIFKTSIFNTDGKLLATATGSESAQDFADFVEKAETKSVGRALVFAGFGTDAAGYDLDEGERFADSPQPQRQELQESRARRVGQDASILVTAMQRFAHAATAAGFHVEETDGRASRTKLCALQSDLGVFAKADFNPEKPIDWRAAEEHLAAFAAARQGASVPVGAGVGDDDDTLTDPFGDEE